MAVMEKRAGLQLNLFDAYINVIGGLSLDEPAADLAVALALVSGFNDVPIDENITAANFEKYTQEEFLCP